MIYNNLYHWDAAFSLDYQSNPVFFNPTYLTNHTGEASVARKTQAYYQEQQQHDDSMHRLKQSPSSASTRLKIAIISGFVSTTNDPSARVAPKYLQYHLTNQVCYADRWGYDYIFNTTSGFGEVHVGGNSSNATSWWLQYGTWHRVPHIMNALSNYDWVLYVDNDYAFQSMNISLDSFIYHWERNGLRNVSVFLPVDYPEYYTFSAFAVFIRNSPFGWRVLQHWKNFAHPGLCRNGNFVDGPRNYTWLDSDQPGLWYALAKTHSEYYGIHFDYHCDPSSGLLQVNRGGGKELNAYFWKLFSKKKRHATKPVHLGFEGEELDRMSRDQPILWSKVGINRKKMRNETKVEWIGPYNTTSKTTTRMSSNGLGLQQYFGYYEHTDLAGNFAIHNKKRFRIPSMLEDLKDCRENRGCFARYNSLGKLEVGCNRNKNYAFLS